MVLRGGCEVRSGVMVLRGGREVRSGVMVLRGGREQVSPPTTLGLFIHARNFISQYIVYSNYTPERRCAVDHVLKTCPACLPLPAHCLLVLVWERQAISVCVYSRDQPLSAALCRLWSGRALVVLQLTLPH